MSTAGTYREALSNHVMWAKTNLFDSKGNTLLTLATLGSVGVLLFLLAQFILFQGNWGLVALNRKLFFFGSYPADETYRIWISVFIASALIAVTYGVWAGRLRPYLITIGVAAIIILTFGLGTGAAIEESQYTEQIVSVGKVTTVSGIERVLVVERVGRRRGCTPSL